MAFRVVVAVGAVTRPTKPNVKTYPRQVELAYRAWPAALSTSRRRGDTVRWHRVEPFPLALIARTKFDSDDEYRRGRVTWNSARASYPGCPCFFPKTGPIRLVFETVCRVAGGL